MKTVKQWEAESVAFHLPLGDLIAEVQKDAYNTAVMEILSNVRLISTPVGSTSKGMESDAFQTYSPTKGMTNITISEQSILKLLKT